MDLRSRRLCLVLLASALLLSCAAVVDRRVEDLLRDALPRLVGPADRYETRVRGASADGARVAEVQATGVRVRREATPVLDRIELRLTDVTVDRAARRVTSIGTAAASVRLTAADLADSLGAQEWIDQPAVRFEPPADVIVSGRLRIPAVPFLTSPRAEVRGQLVARNSTLLLAIEALSLGGRAAPTFVRGIVEQAINPVFDVAAYAVPARIDHARVEGDALVIGASGTQLSLRRLAE